jgi:Ras GTPase-activating protein 1
VERALPCLATVTYLAGEESGDCEDWLSALKPMCVPQMAKAPKVAKLREVRSLTVSRR